MTNTPIGRYLLPALRWLRGSARIWQDGAGVDWLILDSAQAEAVTMHTQDALREAVFTLATVTTAADALAYVERYGLLWHGGDDAPGRERLTAWLSEAQTLRDLLHECLIWRVTAEQMQRAREAGQVALLGGLVSPLPQHLALMEQISNHTGAVRQVLLPPGSAPGVDRFTYQAVPEDRTPLAYLYTAVGQLLVDDVPLAQCRGCGRYFVPDEPRQRYCSQACATRARGRRFRASQRGKTVGGDHGAGETLE